MKKRETVERLQRLAEECKNENDEESTLDLVAISKGIKALNENNRLKIALFQVIKECKVLPTILMLGKDRKDIDIDKMAVEMMNDFMEDINEDFEYWDSMIIHYKNGGGIL